MPNPNVLVKAKEEGRTAFQALITANEALQHDLAEIATELAKGHAAVQEQEGRAAWEEGRLIAEAYALLGDKDMTFQAWWENPETWEKTSSAPFALQYARQLKRLYEFCSGAMSGRQVSKPKIPDGFTTKALIELSAPKYVKDKHGNEHKASKDERTDENQQRLAVVNATYAKLKDIARKRIERATDKGRSPAPVTVKEVQDALRDAFTEHRLPVRYKTARRTNVPKVLDDIERKMAGWYYTFQGEPEAYAAMKAKTEACLAEWDEWQARDRLKWEASR